MKKDYNMKHNEGNFNGANDLNLFYQSWQPDSEIKAIIALVHGFGEHSGRYMNIVNHVLPQGYTVYGFDHRGHGRSEGNRGHIMDWSEFREDLKLFLQLIRAQENELPLFLMGHSMGGLIVLNYMLHHPEENINSVIVSSPLLAQPAISPIIVLISKILSRVRPGFSIETKLDVNSISRDPDVIKIYQEDPLVHSTASARFGTELTATMEWTQSHAKDFNKPLLIYHGASDQLVPPAGSQTFFENVQIREKEMHMYPDGFHEPHNDIDHKTVLQDIENWCNKYI
jgi:alpha-beta hydrolase superfamily lysophospholipase